MVKKVTNLAYILGGIAAVGIAAGGAILHRDDMLRAKESELEEIELHSHSVGGNLLSVAEVHDNSSGVISLCLDNFGARTILATSKRIPLYDDAAKRRYSEVLAVLYAEKDKGTNGYVLLDGKFLDVGDPIPPRYMKFGTIRTKDFPEMGL